MNSEYKPIGKDVVNIYGFVFGSYRYQVEWFDHKKEKENNPDKIVSIDYWDTLYGTKVYKFYDNDYEPHIETYLIFDSKLTKDELKKMILEDIIDWKEEDPYDFKDLFITDKHQAYFYNLFHREKENVKHNYPECLDPYDKCPICGHKLIDDVLDPENVVDIFNYHGGSSEDGPWGYWDEIYRCPHCQKLFYIRGEC